MYDDFVARIEDNLVEGRSASHGEKQLLMMHAEAAGRTDPVVLELGTNLGTSTKVFLNAIHKGEGGQLVSVDIEDFSSVAESPRWTFVQSDSADVENVLRGAPVLREGIDILYIDSLHHIDHVRKELFGFFPYVKDGGAIFFDDVDSLPYMRGQPKDNIHTEIGNRTILNFIQETFEDNQEKLYFTYERGSTGLARLQKRAALGEQLSTTPVPRARHSKLYWKYRRSLEKRLPFLCR